MCGLMYERGELLGLRLPVQNGDASAVALTESALQVVAVYKLNAPVFEKGCEAVDVLAGVAAHFVHGWQVNAVGLGEVEHVGVTESEQYAFVLLGDGGFSLSAFAFARSALKRGMYMPNATWRRRG
jgi:hypothetical protein